MQRDLATVLGCLPDEYPPKVFMRSAPAPLKVGIHLDLLELYPAAEPAKLNRWLRMWTRHRSYLMALASGRPRHDLEGRLVAVVSEDDRRRAARTLRREGLKAPAGSIPQGGSVSSRRGRKILHLSSLARRTP